MFTDPIKNLKQLGLRENMIVVDLGAGTGFYSLAAARMVPRGRVYAIEVEKDFVAALRNKAKEEHLDNLEVEWGNIEKAGGTNIGDGIADAAIASNILFQLENKEKFIKEAGRILKPGGALLFIDWSLESPTLGSRKGLLVPKDKAREMFENEGFVFIREIDASEHHYGIIFEKEK